MPTDGGKAARVLRQCEVKQVLTALAMSYKEFEKEQGQRDWKSSRFDKILAMWSRLVGGKVGRVHLKPLAQASVRWIGGGA